MDNLYLADAIAQKGKSKQSDVIRHNQNAESNLFMLYNTLMDKKYNTSEYLTFTIHEPKERVIFRLPYFPDRIVHHAIMNVLEPIFTNMFTADTYSCIKGKGIHAMSRGIIKALKDAPNTGYYLKLDIKKFYPSVDHKILKSLLRRKFKDNDLLDLLDGIIDSAPGLPIGNYLSQYFANFYLTYFDHWLKEVKGVRYYFRYADDMVIFASNKADLHRLRIDISEYLSKELHLAVKGNYKVSPLDDKSGLDVCGYVFFRHYTLMRKKNKQNFARAVAKGKPMQTINSYLGWAKHCNSKHLTKKLMIKYERVQRARHYSSSTQNVCGRQDQHKTCAEKEDNYT